MNSGIYFIRNTLNNKIYVGSAVDFDGRWSVHRHNLKNNTHHCIHLQNAWHKYGEQIFAFEKIEYVDETSLIGIEQTYLDKYWDNGINCYNICKTAGSWLGMKHSNETKNKLSEYCGEDKGNAKLTEQNVIEIKQLLLNGKLMLKEIAIMFDVDRSVIAKIKSGDRWSHVHINGEENMPNHKSLASSGQNNPMYGKITSDETKSKISNSLKGKLSGLKNPMTKLTEKDVIAIKVELKNGILTQKAISKMFNVGQCTIAEINTGKRWSHIKIDTNTAPQGNT